MSFSLPIANPNDEEAVKAARKQLDTIGEGWKRDIWGLVVLKTLLFITRFGQLIVIADLLAALVLKKAVPGNYRPVFMLALLAVVNIGAAYLTEKEASRFTGGILEQVRKVILDQLEKGLLENKFKQKVGGAILFFGKQAEVLAPYFTRYLPQQHLSFIAPAVTLTFVFSVSWICGLIIVFTVPIVPVYMILIGKGTATAARNEWQNLTEMGGYFYDRIKGVTTLFIFGAEQSEVTKMDEASEKYKESALRVLKMAFLSSSAIDFFSTIIIAGIAIVIGLSMIGYVHFGTAGVFTLKDGLTLLMVVPEFFAALKKLGLYYHDRTQAIGAMMGFQAMGIFSSSTNEGLETQLLHAGLSTAPTGAAVVDIQHLFFNYPDGKTVFKDFSLSLKWGEKLWIKGANGSGKSTLLDLLHGFRLPLAGTINIGGLDTRSAGPQELSVILGWAGQDSRIFRGTLRYNLCMGSSLTDRTIRSRLNHYLDWDAFIAPYEDGLDTLIEEDGKSISGGERHKLSLGRVFLKDAPVLLLDEPFTYLDRESADQLIAAISANKYKKTIIMVTHSESNEQPQNFKQILLHDQL